MNSAMSWSVKGIEPEVREAAKLAARKSGQTMGQWLKTMILDSSERAADDLNADRFVPQRSISRPGGDPVQDRINHLELQLATLTQEQTDTAIGLRFGAGANQGNATLQHVLERLDRNEEATIRTMAVVQERVSSMAQELSDARARSAESPNGWHPSEPEAFERALENVVDHIESTDKETRDTLADLHGKLEALGAELSSGPKNVEIANRKILSDVEHRLTGLAHRVDQIGQVEQHQLKQEFESRLSALTEQIERNGQGAPDDFKVSIESRLSELTQRVESAERITDQVQSDLNATFEKRLKHLSERLEMVGRESEVTAAQVANAAVRSATDDFREIEAKVQELAAQIQSAPSTDPEIAGSVSDLMNQVSGLAQDVQQIKLEAASEQDVHSLRSMFDTLSGTIDQRFAEASSETALAQLEQRLGELSQRLDQPAQAGEPDPKIAELEQRVQEIDTRLATAQSDTQNADALGNQITDLSQRMANAEQHYAGIQTIENSIAKLFEGMEQTRKFASEVAEQSASGMAEKLNVKQSSPESSSTLDALDQGLQALRTSAATADKRNQETLEAVHDTLEKVITRLVALEQTPGDPLQDLVPAPSDYASEAGLPEAGTAGLDELKLPSIPPIPSPQGFTATPEGEGDEDLTNETDEDDYEDDPTEQSDDIYNAEALELLPTDEDDEPQDAPSLAGVVATGDTSKRGDFIAAARTAARIVAEDSDLNASGSVFKGRRSARRGKRAKQSDDTRNSRRRPLVLAAIVLLMIGAAAAYTMVGGKRAPADPEQASAPVERQLMAPAAETAEPVDAPAPVKTPVAAPNDQQSRKSDPLAHTTARVTDRSDLQPLDTLVPAPTQGKQSLDPVPAPAAPRSPEMAGDLSNLTTGSIKSSRRIAPDQVVMQTDPLLFAVPGITPPETKLPAKQTAPVTTSMTAPEITGSTTVSRTPDEPVKTATAPSISQPAVPSVKNLPPPEVGPMGLRVAAAAGDPVAQFVVATRYTEGGSVKQDFRAAAQWYQKAAGRGLAPAQYRLATFYEKGKGVPQDLAAARIWYERAAEKGNRKAMHNLAVIYADGSRGTPDFNKAGIWFRHAAELGLKDSQYNLGILHERGLGVSKDLGQAFKWFALAAKQGDSDAESRMYKMESRLAQQDLVKAKLEVQNWSAKSTDPRANVVTPPADGWQGPGAAANSTSLSNSQLISEAQNLLNKLGYSAGRADGLMGNRTRDAIRVFEKAHNLPVSGTVTPNLLTALRLKASG